ncbi:lipoprotein [Bacteroidia bacterium]|nr:lipoprotein [Bacteroidia bacterium]
MRIINKQLLFLLSFVFFTACTGKPKQSDPHHLIVGVVAGPEYQLAEAAKKVALEKFALDVELVAFNDYIMPNTALDQKDIEVNVYQTRPFLEEQAGQRGYKFAIVGNTFIYPMAGYSKKIKDICELKEGATIVVPNDATNEGRALLLLESKGIIKLAEGRGYAPRLIDIQDNPLRLRILELEAPQLPRSLDDSHVDLAVINNSFAVKAGLFLQNGVIVEDKSSPYVNLIVAREDNQNEEKIKQFVQAYQSDEVIAAAKEQFKDGAIPGW